MLKTGKTDILAGIDTNIYRPRSLAQAFSVPRKGILKNALQLLRCCRRALLLRGRGFIHSTKLGCKWQMEQRLSMEQIEDMLKTGKTDVLARTDKNKYEPRPLAQAFQVPRGGILRKPSTIAQMLPLSCIVLRPGFHLLYQIRLPSGKEEIHGLCKDKEEKGPVKMSIFEEAGSVRYESEMLRDEAQDHYRMDILRLCQWPEKDRFGPGRKGTDSSKRSAIGKHRLINR